jgi:hypothetical protein
LGLQFLKLAPILLSSESQIYEQKQTFLEKNEIKYELITNGRPYFFKEKD